jgi:4-hydroxy-3-methylbut-2-enyl diphosphate reductase
MGFCMGVRRAVEMAVEEAEAGPGVYTLGPLIHNPPVLEALAKRGVRILEDLADPEKLRGATVLLRAHGVSPEREQRLREAGVRLKDATCPRVKANQLKARSLSEEGYRLFLAGEKLHAEIIGIQGYAPSCRVVADPVEAAEAAAALFREAGGVKTALLAQTTMPPETYRAIGEAIRRQFPDLVMVDAICGATRDRQAALTELCAQVEAVIIAGGRSSANTRRLLSIAQSLGKRAWIAESAEDLPGEIGGYSVVGLSAGASSPDWVIEAIEGRLAILPEGVPLRGGPRDFSAVR